MLSLHIVTFSCHIKRDATNARAECVGFVWLCWACSFVPQNNLHRVVSGHTGTTPVTSVGNGQHVESFFERVNGQILKTGLYVQAILKPSNKVHRVSVLLPPPARILLFPCTVMVKRSSALCPKTLRFCRTSATPKK